MEKKTKTKHEPLFHISRRDNTPFRKNALFRVIALIFAFIISSLVLLIYKGYSPIEFIQTLLLGTVGDSFNLFVFLGNVAILLGFGLALVPAFKMKFWNVGADGQALIGGLCCYMVLYYLTIRWPLYGGPELPGIVCLILALIAAIIGGALWGVIPAIFKAKWNTNETLFTLMMNYIAIQLVLFTKQYILNVYQKGKGTTIPIPEVGTLPSIGDIEQIIPIICIAVLAVFIVIYIKKSKHGYELSLVGDSVNSAKYAGINVKWVIIRTMLLSGGIAGFVGFLLITGNHQAIADDMTHSNGFTAIIVAWLASFNPIYMVLTAGLVSFLQIGMNDVMADVGIHDDGIINIFIGLCFFSIIAFEFFIKYKINLRKNDEGEIDNKFFRWLNKVYTPIANFCNKICDAISNFFIKLWNKLFKNKKAEAKIAEANVALEDSPSTIESKETQVEEFNEEKEETLEKEEE